MKFRLPRLQKEKRFRLFVADAEGAPPDQWSGSLDAALRAAARLDEPWRSRAWIIEYGGQPTFGGIPVVRDVVHMRDGERVDDAES
jgi:hypothetical protein